MFWFSLQLLPETVLILRITQRDIIRNMHWSSCTVRMSGFNETWIFANGCSKNTQTSVLIENQWQPSFPCTELESQTEMMKLIVAFSNFAKTPKQESFILPLFVTLFLGSCKFYLFIIYLSIKVAVISLFPWRFQDQEEAFLPRHTQCVTYLLPKRRSCVYHTKRQEHVAKLRI